jgi:ribosomal protein L37E
LSVVLQELCPRCGADWLDGAHECAACGFQTDARAYEVGGMERRRYSRSSQAAVLLLAATAIAIVSFGAGFGLRSDMADLDDTDAAIVHDGARDGPVAGPGRVLFAERLGDSLELESYRTQFTRDDTIAWRAEFQEPPPASELTVVIAWYSVRETMQLSETTVALTDAELTMVASDEVQLADLVPTAGLYSVTYYSGNTKLAEGTFELLPPAR